MLIETTRFGQVDIKDDRIIHFPKGLLGFQKYKHYALLQPSDDSYFFWLQSTEAPDLAFVVTDPSLFLSDYNVPIRQEQMEEIGMENVQDAQVFVIVNKHGNALTGNLQGPLVIDTRSCVGDQLVLADKKYTTRTMLFEVSESVQAQTA